VKKDGYRFILDPLLDSDTVECMQFLSISSCDKFSFNPATSLNQSVLCFNGSSCIVCSISFGSEASFIP
jgi:hypothetical protein